MNASKSERRYKGREVPVRETESVLQILNFASNADNNTCSFTKLFEEARFIDSMHQSHHFHMNLFEFGCNFGFSYNLHVI